MRLRLLVLFTLLVPALALADAERSRVGVGGYYRIMTRPDFQGGGGTLGFWNLYGRLLNEGPYGALELRLDALQPRPGSNEVWASVQTKLEGSSFANAEANRGSLASFRVSQLYVQAGNILLDKVTWRVGTLESYFGDLGVYDMRPATVFFDTLGLSARYQSDKLDVLVGLGDSGYSLRGAKYNSVLTAGATARLKLQNLELGGGGEYLFEPRVPGNRFSPYSTPGVRYEDYRRGEVVRRFVEENPDQIELFPRPVPTSATSYAVVGYLGFGGFGPLRWNSLYARWGRRHPLAPTQETFNNRVFDIYLTDLTDERTELWVGNEMQLKIIPDRLDVVWGLLYGEAHNPDNTIAVGDDNRRFASTVVRGQVYLTRQVHFLLETSVAREESLNGNAYREHIDSVFESSDGRADSRGLQFGDSAVRHTWQLKTGIVINPTGLGIYTRPSLRLLYGLQYSNQHAAYGSGFVEDLDQHNVFIGPERHWHSVVAIEAEGWF
jgi:hypothetical protein